MEQKDIDIYEILKDVPKGTEFYTSLCGNVGLAYLESNKEAGEAIWTENKEGEYSFNKNGRWMKGGEVTFFPSEQMRDWSKFFKKGDVLICYEGKKPYYTIFDGFEDNTYRAFKGKFAHDCYEDKWYQNEGNLSTNTFQKLNRADSEIYVTEIEERFGGKLNRETLEIEKPQPEFKEGDVLFVKCQGDNFIEIFKYSKKNGDLYDHASLVPRTQELDTTGKYKICKESIVEIRLATEEEKEQFLSALEKKGKAWDAEKKQIVDLKPAFELGKLYVFDEEDEDGKVMVIGKLIGKNESEDTLTFGNQYEIENEKFVTDQAFDLDISLHEVLREATENEVELFNKHCAIWKKEKEEREQPAFKPFDKVLVRCGEKFKWLPAFFVRDRGEDFAARYNVLPIHSGKGADFTHCIPYEGHENIAFTNYDIENLPF